MKKVIVTGANGFIGSRLLQELNRERIYTYAVIKDKNENIDSICSLPHIHIVYCSMEQIERLPELILDRDIDTCIHLAWAGSSGAQRADYTVQLQNVQYTMKVVDVLADMRVKRFVGAGTLAEKDVLNYHGMDGATPNAVSIYGIAKITAHYMTKAECTRLGIEHIWCYLSNTYGEGNTTNNFVNMASRIMLEGKSADFTSGEQMYDFVHVEDTVRAICAVADKGRTNTAYYLGSGHERRLKEYIRLIRDAVDPDIELHLGAVPFHGIPLREEAYDASKLAEDTGFRAEIPFEEGIQRTVRWLKGEKNDGAL